MSIQLVLSQYLAGLRERDEIDALLPDLLREMGHSVFSRAQVGVDQGGVDVASTALNSEGVLEVFLFIIKFGDLGRLDFVGGAQSIDPSVRRAASEFPRNRLPAECEKLKKNIILVSNGSVKQEAQAGFAALTKDLAERPLCSLHFWGMDQLAPLIEKYMFNEALLLDTGKSYLRAALAGIEQTEFSVERFARFLDAVFEEPNGETLQSEDSRKRHFLKKCTTASMGWAILIGWGNSENNLKPSAIAGEILLLRLWSESVRREFQSFRPFVEKVNSLMQLSARTLNEYFVKIAPSLCNEHVMARYRPHSTLYNSLLLEEIGRLSLLLLLSKALPDTEKIAMTLAGY